VWRELNAIWRGLSTRTMTQPGACGKDWSVKDVINHIAAWQEAALRVIPQLLKGNRATLGSSVNKFNAIQREADRARTVIASQRRLLRARRRPGRRADRSYDPNQLVGEVHHLLTLRRTHLRAHTVPKTSRQVARRSKRNFKKKRLPFF
jgi:hypothetical protein